MKPLRRLPPPRKSRKGQAPSLLTLSAFLLLLGYPGCLVRRAVDSQTGLQVGYAVLTAGPRGSLPVLAALLSFRDRDGTLVSEAGVEAVSPLFRGWIVVDSGVATLLALTNPSDKTVSVSMILRSEAGEPLKTSRLKLAPGELMARFVSEPELFGPLPRSFLGTLAFEVESGPGIAALAIRQALNSREEPILAALPVVSLDQLERWSPIVFPLIAAGASFLTTQIVLINPTSSALRGEIQLIGPDGFPFEARWDGRPGSSFTYELQPHAVVRGTLTVEVCCVAGYAVVTEENGNSPAGVAVVQFTDPTGLLVSEAGVFATRPTHRARVYVDTGSTQTGVAMVSAGNAEALFRFDLLDREGSHFGGAEHSVPDGGQFSVYASELFGDLPTGFTGVLEVSSDVPFVPVTLKATENRRGQVFTTLPVVDLERPPDRGLLVLPLIRLGRGFSTGLILIGAESGVTASGAINFRRPDGADLPLAILGQPVSRLDFEVLPGAAHLVKLGDDVHGGGSP